ncbi:MAG: hypothetical protein KDA47_14095 [Planctomycetales bacterium]|nr:hypothetical protein [Planctomycetales bacterium]
MPTFPLETRHQHDTCRRSHGEKGTFEGGLAESQAASGDCVRPTVVSHVWWWVGLPVALVVVGVIGAFSKSSVPVFQWKEHAGVFQYHPQFEFRERLEGTGETRFSPLGFSGRVDDPQPDLAKIVIWGDSLVEALQVDDASKMQNLLTRRAKSSGNDSPFQEAVGLGFGATHGLDWLILMQRFSPRLGNVQAHVVLLHDISDLDSNSETLFYLSPEQWRQSQTQRDWPWRARLANVEAGGLYYLMVQANSGQFGNALRFRPGPVAPSAVDGERAFPPADWAHRRWLLSQMTKSLSAPLILVWVPESPRLVHGKIEFEDRRFPGQLERLRRMCDELEIQFVDMQPVFDEHCRTHRELPRGFPNTFPGEGHLNEVGHRLVADRIWKTCQEIADVVH